MKKLLLGLVIVLLYSKTIAQDAEHPNAISFGFNAVDISPNQASSNDNGFDDYTGVNDWNILPMLSRISIAKYLGHGFIADIAGSINSVDNSNTSVTLLGTNNYFAVELGTRYRLNYLFAKKGWFDPYLKTSIGLFGIEEDGVAFSIAPAWGFNTWFNKTIGLNFESSYKINPGANLDFITNNYHFQHSVSLVIRFGDPKKESKRKKDKTHNKDKASIETIAFVEENNYIDEVKTETVTNTDLKTQKTNSLEDQTPIAELVKMAERSLEANIKTVYFNSGKSRLILEATSLLGPTIDIIKKFKRVHFRIEGHCDSRGAEEFNLELSKHRAEKVLSFLVSKGIKKERLEAVGYGETQPIASNKTETGRAKNRRVVLKVITD